MNLPSTRTRCATPHHGDIELPWETHRVCWQPHADYDRAHIYVLTESWLAEHESAPTWEGYTSITVGRPAKYQRNATRGGLIVYCVSHLAKHLTVIMQYHSGCFVVLRLQKHISFCRTYTFTLVIWLQ